MIIERDADCGRLYQSERRKLLGLVRTLGEEQLRVAVPATPAWTVRDVVSHLVGITSDLNAGRFGSGDADAWTSDQVRSRETCSIDELESEWEREALQFEDGLRLLGYEIGSHYVADLLQHESDIRSALRSGRIDDHEALVVALDFYLDVFHNSLRAASIGLVTVRVDGDEWNLGSGRAIALLSTDRFEAFRCLGGRRSQAQIRALEWDGDVDQVLPVISPYPLPQTDIVDT